MINIPEQIPDDDGGNGYGDGDLYFFKRMFVFVRKYYTFVEA